MVVVEFRGWMVFGGNAGCVALVPRVFHLESRRDVGISDFE